ncbi:MAG: HAMP domain-containing histidine kinase [Candidatus Omnitrophica bacterium]|nr:HAMP domain-containing histidine kinase [Candidatus Omnitrophota bacterium]
MDAYIIISALIIGILFILYYFEKNRRAASEKLNKRLQDIIGQLDSQAKIIIKTDLALNKAQEELDKKITGLYTLHELGKEISSTFNIENLFGLINQPFVLKLGFSKLLIMLKNDASGMLATKSSTGYSEAEIKTIESELNKRKFINALFKKEQSVIVNRENESIGQEYNLLDILNVESFITAPIIVKDEPVGFILMGNASVYGKTIEGDSELLSILAGQIGIAIENTKLYTELFGSHKELERRVAERTQELEKLNEELKNLNKMKSDFISAVSHELRTPLTSIKGYASILMAGKLGDVLPAQKERLEKIDKHSNSLVHLINNLLDIARIESGKIQMEIKDISIKEILDSIVDIITPQVKEKNISLKVTSNIKFDKIKADQVQLERALLNLLSNAVKFTPEKGRVLIDIQEKDDDIQFSIEDTGIGIPSQDIPKVFQEFFRADNALDQKIKGSGLGLSLVKKIVEAHKGKIWFNTELGKGTRFTFTLPKY